MPDSLLTDEDVLGGSPARPSASLLSDGDVLGKPQQLLSDGDVTDHANPDTGKLTPNEFGLADDVDRSPGVFGTAFGRAAKSSSEALARTASGNAFEDAPNEQQAANFQRNQAYSTPAPGGYITKLDPDQETQFQKWVKDNGIPFDPSPSADYDMRGFWKSLQAGDDIAKTAINPNDNKVHFPDFYKTPYHESFSNESKWANQDAPSWNDKDQLVDKTGNVIFDERNRAVPDHVNQLLSEKIGEGWKDPDWWAAKMGAGIGGASPALAAGGAATTVSTPIGGAAAFALTSAMQSLPEAYQAARAKGLDHDTAKKQAVEVAGVDGAFAAIMGLVPGMSIFGKVAARGLEGEAVKVAAHPIAEALAQIGVVQPSIGTVGDTVHKIMTGDPVTAEDAATSYVTNVGVGGVLVGGHSILGGAGRMGTMDQAAAEGAPDLTPGDRASPIPDELIAAGRTELKRAEAGQNADDILRANGMPGLGKRVTVDIGDQAKSGTITDAYAHDMGDLGVSGHGVKIDLDDGSQFNDFFHNIEKSGVQIAPERVTAAPDTAALEQEQLRDTQEKDTAETPQSATQGPGYAAAGAEPGAGARAASAGENGNAAQRPGVPEEGVTAADVHSAAAAAGIPSDGDKAFMDWTKTVTGESHLDKVSPAGLELLQERILKGERPPEAITEAAGESPAEPPPGAVKPEDGQPPATPASPGILKDEDVLHTSPNGGRVLGRKVNRLPSGPEDVIRFIARHGGINSAEGDDIGQLLRAIPGAGSLIRKGGRSLDDLGVLLWDNGYFGGGREERPSVREVRALVEQGLKTKTYVPEEQAQAEADLQDKRQALEDKAARKDIAAAVKERREVFSNDDTESVLGLMRDHEIDAHDALDWYAEAQAREAVHDFARETKDESYHDLPFDEPAAPDAPQEGDRGSARVDERQDQGAGRPAPAEHGADEGRPADRLDDSDFIEPGRFSLPKSDKVSTVDGKRDQFVMPGAEQSARQAAEARGEKIKPKAQQKAADEGLFGEPDKQGSLFSLGRETERRTRGIPAAADPPISSYRNTQPFHEHPDYAAAKAGDDAAAVRFVATSVKPITVAHARARYGTDVHYAPVIAQEARGKNSIPVTMARYYAEATGAEVDLGVVQTNRAFHTGMRAMDRLISRPTFDGEVVQGRKYVLVDDASVLGGTLAEMANHIQSGGGDVVGVVLLADASRTGVMSPHQAHVRLVESRFGNHVRNEFGIEPGALTAAEARYLSNFRDADTLGDRIASAKSERDGRQRAQGVQTSPPDGEETGSLRAADTAPRATRSFSDAETTALKETLVARLREIDPTGKLALRLVKNIEAVAAGKASPADGRYLRKLVEISLQAPDALWTLNHESIHGLKDLGLFRDAEWKTLENAALADKDAMDEVRTRYAALHLTDEQLVEERIADMFANWRAGNSEPKGFIRTAFERVVSFIKALHAGLTEAGYRTVEDIFHGVDKGYVGSRVEAKELSEHDVFAPRGEDTDQARQPVFAVRQSSRDRKAAPIEEPIGRVRQAVTAIRTKVGSWLAPVAQPVRMALNPMSAGTETAQAVAKDFANAMRAPRFELAEIDKRLRTDFTPEQRAAMWRAADADSVALQTGEKAKARKSLPETHRATVEALQADANEAFADLQELGVVKGEPLPSYVPRLMVWVMNGEVSRLPAGEGLGALESVGRNLKTSSPNLRQRKHLTAEDTTEAGTAKFGEGATIIPDIRTLPFVTARLREVAAGRSLINAIKEIGRATGDETVSEGGAPTGTPHEWFTLDHPAMKSYRPDFTVDDAGKIVPRLDAEGQMIYKQVPIFIRGDFKGPLNAVLSRDMGQVYNGFMNLKGGVMSVLMFSPAIHNMVILGKAFPAMPGKMWNLKVYREGYQARQDMPFMRQAIKDGLAPIGGRGAYQDITSLMEAPNIDPGRSFTAKLLGFIPGLFDARAGNAVKAAVDKAGDFWHNKLLWDRVFDLQVGLYKNFRQQMVADGMDPVSAGRVAGHLANRYAGSIPTEAMSAGARAFANVMLFSRSFTLGNLGIFKDAATGLPSDVRAQISRDAGKLVADKANTYMRRKSAATLALDFAMNYGMNAAFASAAAVLLGKMAPDDELKKYVQRVHDLYHSVVENPLQLLNPFHTMLALTPMAENEPGKESRVFVGNAEDGTAIYMRSPFGKTGDDLEHWLTSTMATLKNKMSPFAKTAYGLLANDKGFDRKIYDPFAETPEAWAQNIGDITKYIAEQFLPMDTLKSGWKLLTGQSSSKTLDKLKVVGPLVGFTFSKGAPGGQAMGEYYRAKDEHEFQVQRAMPDIREKIRAGDEEGARADMSVLGIDRGTQNYYIKSTLNPATTPSKSATKKFGQYATPEQQKRLDDAIDRAP